MRVGPRTGVPTGGRTPVRVLGPEPMTRPATPFLTIGPAAVWQCASADAMFAAFAAWGMACLALAATRRSVGWSTLAGLLLAADVSMMSKAEVERI